MGRLTFLVVAAAMAAPLSAGAEGPLTAPVIKESDRYGPWVASTIEPGVHLLAAAPDWFGPVVGNVTLIEQTDGWVVIDSGLTASNGREVVRYARTLSPKPIKAVAITHWHNDHPQGVSAIRDAFPNVRIITTVGTEKGMLGAESFGVDYKPNPEADAAIAKLAEPTLEQLNKILADPATAPDRRERVKKAIGQYQAFPKDFAGTYIVPPTETFERRLLLADALRPVELIHLGRGNTDGDLIAWLPNQKIVASGDIVVAPVPFGFFSYPGDWIETLGKLKAMPFDVLIPGHGDPQRDRAYLDKLIVAIGDIRAKVAPLAKAGVKQDEIKAKVDWAATIAPFGDTPRNKANFEGLFIDPMIPNAYKEALGQPIIQGEGNPAPPFKVSPPKSTAKRHDS
jgi:glyoxylase-like metal-dependent hydrolase (beta-lactamase superfamily II)